MVDCYQTLLKSGLAITVKTCTSWSIFVNYYDLIIVIIPILQECYIYLVAYLCRNQQ